MKLSTVNLFLHSYPSKLHGYRLKLHEYKIACFEIEKRSSLSFVCDCSIDEDEFFEVQHMSFRVIDTEVYPFEAGHFTK